MIKCAILDDYQNVALRMANWSSIHHRVAIRTYQQPFETEQALVSALQEDEIIVLMRERTPFTAAILKKLPNLKLLITSGMRNASIDLDVATEQNVIVSGTANYSEPPVELTWGLMLALTRNIVTESTALKEGRWQSTVGVDLKDKQLGLLGLGKTGAQMAKIGKAFGMNVCAWSQNLTQEATNLEGIQLAKSKRDLLEKSDFVSVHLVLSPRTRHLISAEDFQIMKKSSYFINTSRSGIVNQEAMFNALKNHQIAGAAADVFDIEPLPKDHILRTLPNFIGTPHIGYVTEKNYNAYFGEAVENIQAYLEASPVRQINVLSVNASNLVL